MRIVIEEDDLAPRTDQQLALPAGPSSNALARIDTHLADIEQKVDTLTCQIRDLMDFLRQGRVSDATLAVTREDLKQQTIEALRKRQQERELNSQQSSSPTGSAPQ
jgi:hypothetical protein